METATIAWLERRELTDTLAFRLPNRTHYSAFPIAPNDKHSALRLTLRVLYHLWSCRLGARRGSGFISGGGSRGLPLGKHPAPEATAWRRI